MCIINVYAHTPSVSRLISFLSLAHFSLKESNSLNLFALIPEWSCECIFCLHAGLDMKTPSIKLPFPCLLPHSNIVFSPQTCALLSSPMYLLVQFSSLVRHYYPTFVQGRFPLSDTLYSFWAAVSTHILCLMAANYNISMRAHVCVFGWL